MSKAKVLTHKGVLRGLDARTRGEKPQLIRLRETKCYWISQWGKKYSKKWGAVGGAYPMYRLDLKTIKPLEESEKL